MGNTGLFYDAGRPADRQSLTLPPELQPDFGYSSDRIGGSNGEEALHDRRDYQEAA